MYESKSKNTKLQSFYYEKLKATKLSGNVGSYNFSLIPEINFRNKDF